MRTKLVIALLAALAACGRPDAVADEAENTDALPEINKPSASPTGAMPANAVTTPAPAVPFRPVGNIPPALQGRWALTPRDCTSTLGDAKGLLIINKDELRFYESRAVPAAGAQTTVDSISGDFAFTGEGQQWTKYEAFELRDGKLVRTERDPIASFTYAPCR
jgi:hypothetical protein